MALDERSSQQVLGELIALARKAASGADVQARLTSGRSANTRFAKNEITSTGDVDESEVRLSVAFGKRQAEATSNQIDRPALESLVERVVRLARLAPENPERMPLLGAETYLRTPSSHDAAVDALGAPDRAAAAESAIARARSAKVEAAGFYQHDSSAIALMNSAGLRSYHHATSANFSLTARTPDGTGSGWAGAIGHRKSEVDASALAQVAIDKAVGSAKPRRLEPGRYTVILEPAAVAELLNFLTGSLAARPADEGRSFFSRPGGGTRLGERLFGESITLRSDPTDAATPGAPFDGEGFPLRPITWIERGTLRALAYSRYWAAQKGQKPTGQPQVFHLQGGSTRAADLLAGVKRGVLITRFWYTRWLDPQSILITGLTRDGVFLVENGQVAAPVNNFRFNESPILMLKNADAITAETVRTPAAPGLRVPALRTHEFNLASISEAV